MAGKLVLHQTRSLNRRQALLAPNGSSSSSSSSRGRSRRVGEAAGVTVVECAAVCCCPCAVVNLLVLTVCKLPAGLCRKALKQGKGSRRRNGLRQQRSCHHNDIEFHLHTVVSSPEMEILKVKSPVTETDKDVMELEKEMWEWFNGTGFWRSPSQRVKP